jgi:pimeloyl-ACP methyl ester carboxylesterase
MKQKLYLLLLLAVMLAGCNTKPENLSDIASEYANVNDSIRVHYKIYGDGNKTICFVHGFGCDLNTWEKQFKGLSDDSNLRLLFIDLPGYGKSSKPHVEYTLDFFAKAVNAVLDKEHVGAVVLVGHSLGTPVCRQVLMSGRQGYLVDIDGVYCFYDGTETAEYVEAVNQFGHAFDGPNCSEVIAGFVTSLAGAETPQSITDYAMSVMPKTPPYVASSTMRNLVERQWWSQRPLHGRAMVICTQNSGLEPDNRQKMERLYPHLDYTELTTCGHFIHMEQPDMFNEKLKKFVNCEAGDVQILMEIRPEVNYVTHLYTLAELGFSDSAYVAKYGNTLPQTAIDTLQKYKDYLTFGQGEGGILAGPFFFGVSAVDIPNADSMQVVMNVVMNEGRKANAPVDVMVAVRAVADVYVAHYDAYLKNVYPQVKADMEERRQLLSQKVQELSFVKDWERVTGYTWHRGDYHWLLYRAGQKGPSYNNLNDSTNTVWYNQDINYQLAMFSHEFGIFLMQDSIDPIVEEFKEYTRKLDSERDLTYVPWSAFESLACWYNCKIAGHETADYRAFDEADVQTFCRIFDRLSKDGISAPAELYRKGIMEYLNNNDGN